MFLKSLHLRNFRCFSDLNLDFYDADTSDSLPKIRKTTILLGDNGVGKSNLLKAIALVTAGRDALADLLGEPNSWIQVGKDFCQLDALLVTEQGLEREVSLRIEQKDSLSNVLDRARESMAELDQALEYTNRNYFVLGYGVSRRLNPGSKGRFKVSESDHIRSQNVNTLFNPDGTLTPIENWAMDLDYRKNEEGLVVVREVMSDFLPEVSFESIDKENKRLMFKTSAGVIPMHQLSDGYQNVVAWVGDLLYRITETFKDYESPLKTRGLLLIDEVDLHLHPSWQRDLLTFLKNKLRNLQIVATTHSPFTAQQADVNELYYFRRKGKSISLETFEGPPKHLLLHQLIMSDAFGVTSDESKEMESKKSRFEKLSGFKKLTEQQKCEFESLKEELLNLPHSIRTNALLPTEQLRLLEDVQKELKEQS